MKDFLFENGQTVKEVVTGFTGVIMGRTDYLTGCNRYGVMPVKLSKEGKRAEWEWLDETVLELVAGAKKIVIKESPALKTGGPGRSCEFAPSN